MLDPCVNDEKRQAGGLEIEGHLSHLEGASVEEQGMAGPAQQRGSLVHDPCRYAHVLVLCTLGNQCELLPGKLQVVKVVQRQRD